MENNKNNSVINPQVPQNPQYGDVDVITEKTNDTFSDLIRKNLPEFFKNVYECVKPPKGRLKAELKHIYTCMADIVILGVLGVLSSALPNLRFMYRRVWYDACLMIIIGAQSGGGKGILESVFHLADHIHEYYRNIYNDLLAKFKEQQNLLRRMTDKQRREFDEELLEKPLHLFFRLAGDSTYAAFLAMLQRMSGYGFMGETELDVINQAFSSDMGNYSVLLRKNFEHEGHQYKRKGDDEYAEIPRPAFATVGSGTPDQIDTFISSVQNGLFSRFIYYFCHYKPGWIDAVDDGDTEIDNVTFFRSLGEDVHRLYLRLKALTEPLHFNFTKQQRKKLNDTYHTQYDNYTELDGDDIHGVLIRMPQITMRIAMVLTMSRLLTMTDEEMDKALSGKLECSNTDFNTALTIALTLLRHSSWYFEYRMNINAAENLLQEEVHIDLGREDANTAIESLPKNRNLTSRDIVDRLIATGVPESTAKKTIARCIKGNYLKKVSHGIYRRTTFEEFLIGCETAKKIKKAKKKLNGKK